jgi:hypothetical protein
MAWPFSRALEVSFFQIDLLRHLALAVTTQQPAAGTHAGHQQTAIGFR